MKICKLLLVICMFSLQANGQFFDRDHPSLQFGKYFYFDAMPDRHTVLYNHTITGIYIPDSAVSLIFERQITQEDRKLSSPIALGIKLPPTASFYAMAPVKSFSKSFPAFRVKDKFTATVIAMGINKNNIDDYRYRVVLNDSAEVVPWSQLPKLEQKYGAEQAYGFVGEFNYPGKQALVEVVSIKSYQLRSGVMFDWRKNISAEVFALTGSAPKNNPNASIDFTGSRDQKTQLINKIECVQGTTGTISLYLKPHPGVAYASLITRVENGKLLHRSQGELEGFSGALDISVDTLKAGKYQIHIFARNMEGQISDPAANTEIELDIVSTKRSDSILEKKASFKQLIPYAVAVVLVIAVLFWLYRRRANVRLAQVAQAKQNVSLKMRSIRAQLNPHFMFNALTSIQNLVNKKDMEGANHYLSRFADLTRKVLFTSERDLISVEDEVKILDDYLQMEQLRFGFRYELNVAKDVNTANIEVPAMLLQPFVENAVKHGVANLREKGLIKVSISLEKNNVLFSISDNGLGFSYNKNGNAGGSFGLKLSEERIALLNEVYIDQPAKLEIRSGSEGTTVTITLANWIS
jgi:two-component system LytT family sensor kinase